MGEVPHFTTERKTEVSVVGAHFIETERTPALTTKPVGLDGAAAVPTTGSLHLATASGTHVSCGVVPAAVFTRNALRNSLTDKVGVAESMRATTPDAWAAAIEVPCRYA